MDPENITSSCSGKSSSETDDCQGCNLGQSCLIMMNNGLIVNNRN